MTNIDLGQFIDESLSSTDTNNPKRLSSFSDDYTLTGVSNWQQVQVNLDSSAFDTYLQLINASTGEEIAFDDDSGSKRIDPSTGEEIEVDSGSGRDSQLSFTKFPGVDYIIRATSANSGETGNYTLKTTSLDFSSSIIATRDGKVGTVGGASGNFAQIATSNLDFSDIALSNSGQLFGITFGNLYKIEPNLGSASLIGNFGLGSSVKLNALEFANNTLYAAGDSKLYTINSSTGAATLVANLGSDFNSSGDLVFDATNNRFLATSTGTTSDSLFSVSLTGEATKIGDIGFKNVFGISSSIGGFIGFIEDKKYISIDSRTGKGSLYLNVTGVSGAIGAIEGASPILGRSGTPTPTPPTPTPPTVVTPTPLTLPTPPPTSNNTQQPSTSSSSISITSASDLADGDQKFIPGGTIVLSGLATGLNSGSSNLLDFFLDNLKVFVGDIPIPLTGIDIKLGSNPVEFGTNITLPNNISPGNYPLKLVLNTGTGSSISGVGPTLGIIPANATGAVKADFVDSITDQKLKLKLNIIGTTSGAEGAAVLTTLINPFVAAGIAVTNLFAQRKLLEGSDKFPYGYLPDDLLIKDDLENPDPSQRNITLKFVSESSTQANKTWIVIHGWNDSANDDPNYAGDFSDLGKAVAQANPNDQVLLLDWKEAAAAGKLNKNESNIDALLRLGNYTAAKWIRPVAEWVVKNLKEKFGLDAEYASKNLNLIGHSLGSLLSNEIARVWQEEQTAEKKGIDQNGKGIGVNTIFVLDPPSQLSISALSLGQPGFGYDVDGRTAVMDFISPDSGEQQIYLPNFKEVSNFSRAFVGRNSLAGNQIFAAQADESFQMSFSDRDRDDIGQEHLWVVEAFKNLIIQKNELADIGKLVNPNPILTDLKGKDKAYDNRHAGILAFNTPTIETKDLKDDKDLPKPRFLTVENKEGGNLDDIVYGTNEKDSIIFILEVSDGAFPSKESILYSGAGNDIFYGKAGDDLIFGGSGNDTIYGEQDKDSINGAKDNDILFGGANDDIIWGGKEDDTLIGGKGKDTLTGGLGSDIFVFAPGDGAASRDEADIITDFGTGFIVGGGTDRIGLAGGLKADMIQLETFGGTFGIGERTALKANGQYLAVLNSKFSKNDLNFWENFSIV